MKDSNSRALYDKEEPRLFDSTAGGRSDRRLTKAEALEYVRIVRAQLHRGALDAEHHRHIRKVA